MGKKDKHFPIVAVTGSSGAGTSTVKEAFGHVFFRENIKAILIEGDSFHRYDRDQMKLAVQEAHKQGRTLSHFGRDANLFEDLAELFKTYRKTGVGDDVTTCIPMTRHNPGGCEQVSSRPGRRSPRHRIYSCTKDCTAGSARSLLTLTC